MNVLKFKLGNSTETLIQVVQPGYPQPDIVFCYTTSTLCLFGVFTVGSIVGRHDLIDRLTVVS